MKQLFTIGLMLICALFNSAHAASTWQSLSVSQQQALQPLAQQWAQLPEKQQHSLLHVANRYPTLSPTEKQRFQKNLIAWSKLTPEQRKIAREKYRALSKNHHEKSQLKQKLLKKQSAESILTPTAVSVPSAASSVMSPTQIIN